MENGNYCVIAGYILPHCLPGLIDDMLAGRSLLDKMSHF